MGVEEASDQLYRDKVILAPMVRAGTLPLRALALRYGADTVFTEEVIDRRIVNAVRTENPVLGTVDYVESRGKKGTAVPFQTCPAIERDRVVYQIGTGDATNALRAAQHVERDVAAVDINMGCPKRFSLQGGMGAQLLKRPQVAADIVGTLRSNLSVPVSVKMRLLDTPSETVEFARRMEKAGACALTVHVRRVGDTPSSKARWEELRPVVDAVNIPVIANGDVYTRADMAGIKALSGCSSVMLARPALLNCSVFKPDGHVLPLKEVIQQYLRECFRYDSVYQNAKYTVMEMLTKRRHPDHLKQSICLGLPEGAPGMREVTPAKTLEQLARLWDVGMTLTRKWPDEGVREEQLHVDRNSGTDQAERGCVHRFDDAYFLEPEASKDVVSTADNSSDSLGPSVARGGQGGGGGGGDTFMTAAAEIGENSTVTCTAVAVPEVHPDTGSRQGCGRKGGRRSGSGVEASASGEGQACPEGRRDRDNGRARGGEAAMANGASAGDEDGGGGAGAVEERQQLHNGGVACEQRGNGRRGGRAGGPSGDGVAEEGTRRTSGSSKRPREVEEASAGAAL